MLNLQLAKKYAVAMYEVAQDEGKLIKYGEQLEEIRKLFADEPMLKAYMSNPQVQPKAKKELLNKVFGSDVPSQHGRIFLWQKLIRQDFGRAFSTQKT